MTIPLISIIICTRNRAQALSKTLFSLNQIVPPPSFRAEVLVVDNGSTDDTSAIVRNHVTTAFELRYVSERNPGQARARNTGLQHARGEIIVFTDDDVVPSPEWLSRLCAPILQGEADAVAGAIEIPPHLQRPWMTPLHRMMLCETKRFDPANPTDMIGANMAFARRVLDRVPLFDTELGPGALGFWDDTLFSFQLREAGYRLAVALDAVVEHHFDSTRLNRQFWLNNAKGHGRSFGYVLRHWEHKEMRHPFLQWLARWLRLRAWRLVHPPFLQPKEGCCLREYVYVRTTALHYQFRIECRRPHHYPLHGLRKPPRASGALSDRKQSYADAQSIAAAANWNKPDDEARINSAQS